MREEDELEEKRGKREEKRDKERGERRQERERESRKEEENTYFLFSSLSPIGSCQMGARTRR